MASQMHLASLANHKAPSMKPRLTMDDAIAIMEMEHQMQFRTEDEKRLQQEMYEHKIKANEL